LEGVFSNFAVLSMSISEQCKICNGASDQISQH